MHWLALLELVCQVRQFIIMNPMMLLPAPFAHFSVLQSPPMDFVISQLSDYSLKALP